MKAEYGDIVAIKIGRDETKIFTLEKGGVLHTRHGWISHEDIAGRLYGSTVKLSTGRKGIFYRPTLSEKILAVFERRSQVIYPRDAYLMIGLSGIGYGDTVGEAGVGSGFLSAFILDRIGEKGTYFGYELREDMARVALGNLAKIYPRDRFKIILKDVREGVEEKGFDAFFLDMPDPWRALGPLHASLSSSSRIVVFTPTVNQVLRILEQVEKTNQYMVETLLASRNIEYEANPFALRPRMMQWVHTGYITVLVKREED